MFHRIAVTALLLFVLLSISLLLPASESAGNSSLAGGESTSLRRLQDDDYDDARKRHDKNLPNLQPYNYYRPDETEGQTETPEIVIVSNDATKTSSIGLGAMLGIAGAAVAAIFGLLVAGKRLRDRNEEEDEEEVDETFKDNENVARKGMDFSNIVVEEESVGGEGDQSTVLESSMDVSHEDSVSRVGIHATVLRGGVLAEDAEDQADNELMFDRTANV